MFSELIMNENVIWNSTFNELTITHWRQPTKDNKRCLHSSQIQTTVTLTVTI